MNSFILGHETAVRLLSFGGLFVLMAFLEAAKPRRQQARARRRWAHNLGLVVLGSLLIRALFPLAAVGVALLAEEREWGLFHYLGLPAWLGVLLAVPLLDLAIYFQHRVFHAIPWLWRLHRVHHSDTAFDVSTAVRFHPLELALSMLIKMGLVLALGAPAVAVVIFEVLLSGGALFNHSNWALPLDRWLRWLIVTPDMHRVHHSVYREETDSNFGFNLACWDRLFGTYRAQPRDGHAAMRIGLERYREPADGRLDHLLLQPFRGEEPAPRTARP